MLSFGGSVMFAKNLPLLQQLGVTGLSPREPEEKKKVVCYLCDGKRRYFHELCQLCGGKGYIYIKKEEKKRTFKRTTP